MPAADTARPDPDALLIAAAQEGKGRLKVFLGAAPGVGKTWDMLNAARRRRAEGVDVLVGIVESHGRAETQAQLGDLPVLPRRPIVYRGRVLQEFDLDAAMARRPGLLLLDELAHTNAPGSRHNKRWEDAAELLEAGIDVWATLNVQHLESLNDSIARITGIRISETLPDRVLEMADEIEFVDLTPAELRTRLKEGRIYRPDVARQALEGFFREGNLAALREIALRQAAQRVDRDVRDYMRQNAIAGPWPAGDCVLALIGSDAAAETVVRAAKRLAEALHAPWIVLHVERPGNAEHLRHGLDLAAQLGATVEVRAASDLVQAVLDFAATRNVTHLVIGRGRPPLWRRFIGRTLAGLLVRRAGDFALHVVPVAGVTRPLPLGSIRHPAPGWYPWAFATLLVGGIVLAGELFSRVLQHETLGMLFLAVVVACATLWGLGSALYAAALGFLCWNVLFIPPLYTLTIYDTRDLIGLCVFAGIATTAGWLASRVRREARVAQGRIESLRRITGFSRRLGQAATEPALLEEIARLAAEIAGRAVVLTVQGDELEIAAASAGMETLDEGSWAAARWAWEHQETTGRGSSTLPSSTWRFIPMQAAHGLTGLLGVCSQEGAVLDQPQTQALSALADQSALTLDRLRLAAAAARNAVQAETQKLRTALLNSLSHDLRTPLTGIRGAAGSLRLSWKELSEAARNDLLASIEHDTVRMTRFLANITEMIRLESGEIVPRHMNVRAAEVVDAALARLTELGLVMANLPDDLPEVSADPQLLEQALVNVLENAVKFSPHNAPIRITGGVSDGHVRISIADEGVGIAAADLPHVFDSFYRAQREDRTIPGTGLGLAIARGLIEAMGGRIEAQSPRPNAASDGAPGTVMHIDMPAVA